MRVTEELSAWGHANITAKHRTTFEITRDRNVTKRGDCIIAVRATRALTSLSPQFRNLCRDDDARVTLELEVAEIIETMTGTGSTRFTLSDPHEIVGRRSAYVSDGTLMINADKAACDINRDLINALKSQATSVRIRISVEL